MESLPIAEFLESTYPDPPVPLTSELGREVEAKVRPAGHAVFRASVLAREMGILSPRAQEYFRRTREGFLGHRLEDLMDPEKEEQSWNNVEGDLRAAGDLTLTNKAEGPFVLGPRPSYIDFWIAGFLQFVRVVDEGVYQRFITYPGYKEIYEACLPLMKKND